MYVFLTGSKHFLFLQPHKNDRNRKKLVSAIFFFATIVTISESCDKKNERKCHQLLSTRYFDLKFCSFFPRTKCTRQSLMPVNRKVNIRIWENLLRSNELYVCKWKCSPRIYNVHIAIF